MGHPSTARARLLKTARDLIHWSCCTSTGVDDTVAQGDRRLLDVRDTTQALVA
jgi:hypothetical protein